MSDTIEFTLLTCDEPSPITGRIYPLEAMKKAVADYQEKIKDGRAMGTMDYSTSLEIPLDKISHKVTEMYIDIGGHIVTTIEILDTPMGKIAKDLIENLRLGPAMTGIVLKNNIVIDNEILYTALLPKEENEDG